VYVVRVRAISDQRLGTERHVLLDLQESGTSDIH
jgi:hypothetical protein